MTTRYQKSQIEDVARVLSYHTTAAGMDDEQERMQWLTWIAKSFVDLFAADNPPIMKHCWCYPECTDVRQVSGFDRERFLAACGLESKE